MPSESVASTSSEVDPIIAISASWTSTDPFAANAETNPRFIRSINNGASPVGYYIPIAQSDVANGVRIAVRTRGDAVSLTPLLRSAVTSLDPGLAIYEVSSMRRVIGRQTWFYTTFGTFFMAFGICALLLAAAGLYGVMSFAVTQRTREMGVRSALGAKGAQLIALVMRRSVVQLAIGVVLGLVLAILAAGALRPLRRPRA